MSEWLEIFGSMSLLIFALGTLIGGAFTAYFGSGKSRAIGGLLLLIGIIAAIFFYAFTWGIMDWEPSWAPEVVKNGIIAIVGAIVGGAISLGVLLAGIMKA